MGKLFYVYEHSRPDKDLPFYVGKGTGRRAHNMENRSVRHKRIRGKLSRLGMCVEVRLVRDGLTNEEALSLEIERIAFWRAGGVRLANGTDGGEGATGYRHTKKSLSRIATAAKKLWEDPAYRERQREIGKEIRSQPGWSERASAWRKKDWEDPFYRERVVAGVRLAWSNPALREEQGARHKGRKRPPETGRKISAALKGCVRSDEFKRHASEWQTGRTLTLDHKESLRLSTKALWADPVYREKTMAARRASVERRKREREEA